MTCSWMIARSRGFCAKAGGRATRSSGSASGSASTSRTKSRPRWRSGPWRCVSSGPASGASTSWICSSQRWYGSRRTAPSSRSSSVPRSRAATGCVAATFARRSQAAPRGFAPTARCSSTPAPAPRWCATATSSYLSRPMLLAFDIGNTETTVGLFANDRLEAHWRLHSTPNRTPDEWAYALTAQLTQSGHSTQEIRTAILASVAPQITENLSDGIEAATTRKPTRVDGRSKLPLVLDVEEPLTVGADRIVNTLAAAQLFKKDTIVVDFGTATTFDCITVDGGVRFIGGVIMPGLRTASDELVRKTAKLPATELTPPTRAIGRRTEDCIRAGVLWGTADAVDGMVRRIRAEWPSRNTPMVVATGGRAGLVAPLCNEIESVHPDLTLVGLRIAAAELGLQW